MSDEPVDDLDDTPCQPNIFGFCKWCGKDMQDQDNERVML